MRQITDTIMMVRPANFGFNAETAENNAFQTKELIDTPEVICQKAQSEFDEMVATLRSHGVNVEVVQDTPTPVKPDAIFPNNWISMHESGKVITYPMYAKNRSIERREDIVSLLEDKFNFKKRYSFEQYEDENVFLEGTGSMILDREHKKVYACLSERTDIHLLDKFSRLVDFQHIAFNSVDRNGFPIYHTNVMMAIGVDFCVIVLESIHDEAERKNVIDNLTNDGKALIDLSYKQMEHFAGNMLQVKGSDDNYLVMSQTAYNSLEAEQIVELRKYTKLLPIAIPTIERYGGGSVRCMMAEVFYPE